VVFRRRQKDGDGGAPAGAAKAGVANGVAPDDDADDEKLDDTYAESGGETGGTRRTSGPWDSAEVPNDDTDRVDLGGVLIPIIAGMELRAEIADDRIVAATLIVGQSALQIQPFAAPRSMGIWDEVRGEIEAGIREQGGHAAEAVGRFGAELRAQVPVRLPDGSAGIQVARFLGVDGPRWFLRGVITGQAAVEPRTATALEEIFAGVVVVRGVDPMAPRDPIELRLPEDLVDDEDEESGESPDFNPFARGPEITEIR
jgi:hypothetical protein